MKFSSSTTTLIFTISALVAVPRSHGLRVPFLNRRAASTSPILTVSGVARPLELSSSSSLGLLTTSTGSSSTQTTTMPPPAMIASGMDLMCLTNTVQHIVGGMADDDDDETIMIESLENSLTEQRNLMTARIADIDHALPTLLPPISSSSTSSFLLNSFHMEEDHHPAAVMPVAMISVHMNHNVVATHWDALSHLDYTCVMNQIRTNYAAPPQQAIMLMNTLQQERTIAMARISLIEDSLDQLLSMTNDVAEDDDDDISHDDETHPTNTAQDFKSLMDSIDHVLTMEQQQNNFVTSSSSDYYGHKQDSGTYV